VVGYDIKIMILTRYIKEGMMAMPPNDWQSGHVGILINVSAVAFSILEVMLASMLQHRPFSVEMQAC
jgi:hypothetical protein